MAKYFACMAGLAAAMAAGPCVAQTDAGQTGGGPVTMPVLAGRDEDVPQPMRQAIMDKFAHSFLLPQLVMWDFTYMQPYPTGGIAVCGLVDYPNSTRQYVGKLPFFTRFEGGRIVQAGIVARSRIEDPVHANADAYKIACGDV